MRLAAGLDPRFLPGCVATNGAGLRAGEPAPLPQGVRGQFDSLSILTRVGVASRAGVPIPTETISFLYSQQISLAKN